MVGSACGLGTITMAKAKHNSTDAAKEQPDKFRDAARRLGCDEDEARFEENVRRVAKATPPPEGTPSKEGR
jgi:hypothetical protein